MRRNQGKPRLTPSEDAANGKPVPAIVIVGGIDVRTIEVQIVGVSGTVRRRRPIVPVRPTIVERTGIVVASEQETRHNK